MINRLQIAQKMMAFTVVLALVAGSGSAVLAETAQPFALGADAQKFAVLLAGASIDKDDGEKIQSWVTDLRQILVSEYGYPEKNITVLSGNNTPVAGIDGPCRADTIRQTFAAVSRRVKPADQLLVVMIGHGSGAGENAKFNIVGPDLTATDYAQLIDQIETPHIAFVNTTAASYDLAKAISAKGRVSLSATRSSAEKYATLFPEYFIEGLRSHSADRDKNGRVSLLEIFNYSKASVNAYFKDEGTLPTEHASLDDNGDGVFSLDTDRQSDGGVAEVAYFDVLGKMSGPQTPEAKALRQAMNQLERQIFLLRSQKPTLPGNDYWQQLEPLLIELARTTKKFNEL